MAKIQFFILQAILIFCGTFLQAKAQELQANVLVNFDMLPVELRIDVQSMRDDVMRYLNSQRYTGKDWVGPKIPIDVSITLTGRTGNRYAAILTVMSRRLIDGPERGKSLLMRSLDKNWQFTYAPNASLTFQTLRFDEFSTLIDFYMVLAIGMDMDTYGELDGSPMFSLAKDLVRLGAAAGASGYQNVAEPGDPSRIAIATELTDLRYEEFRKLVFSYHVDGMDSLSVDRASGLRQVESVIAQMAEFKRKKVAGRSIILQAFFDSKYQELADLFRGSDRDDVFRNLMFLDPSNTTVYEQAKDGK
ncbi:MAG: DUF4835 family protein [Ignavibacteria bacterium]|nr:DUF4835 family protein [Ignavibacteria bacterium]